MRIARNAVVLVLIALAWAALVYKDYYRHRHVPMYDFIPTYVAARMIGDPALRPYVYERNPDHLNLVPEGRFKETTEAIGFPYQPTPYVYPPFYAWLLQPVAAAPYATARDIILFFSGLGLMAGLVCAFLVLGDSLRWWTVFLAAPLLLLPFDPLRYGNWLGQISTVIFGLTCVSLWLAHRGRIVPAGIILGLCLAVKIQPIGIPILLLAHRRYKLTVVAGATAVVLLAAGVPMAGADVLGSYMSTLLEITSKGSLASWNNQTIVGLLLRATQPAAEIFRWRYLQPDLWMKATQLLVTLGLFVWYVRAARSGEPGPDGGDSYVPAYVGGALLSLILPPIVWNHSHILAVLPVLYVVSRAHGSGSTRQRASLLIGTAVCWGLMSLRPSTIARVLLSPGAADPSGGLLSLGVSANLFGVLLLAVLYGRAVGMNGPRRT